MRFFALAATVIFTSLIVGSARAQTGVGSLIGIVRDSAGVPQPRVQFIIGTRLVTNSDSAGRFVLTRVPAGRYPIRVLALGFYELTFPVVEFVGGDTVRLDFRLLPKPWRDTECMTVEGCRQSR